ncbi:E3 ubiquitin ligase complex scf subunit sconc [Plakobranchus ocellatus]|uniref:E3 ubiquitin ligase complex scf subunit sconc n=1 Tax=Plakobranchus ocellatus TaxID=259542 RepID=A0AAV3ZPH1_9GAST|nr:E3 ubiquitin ligase complex scf subunit sconc [Plakobranchus ocellatus]
MGLFKLMSSDGELFEVDAKVLKLSVLLSPFAENAEEDSNIGGAEVVSGSDEPIPVANVKASVLKKVIEWCEYHRDDDFPASDDDDDENRVKRMDDICAWDAEFLNVEQNLLFEIILAANYLNIKGLLDASCKTVANQIKGKSPEEIRKTFKIKDDLTPAE